jgi:hypothetical protein
VNGPKPEERAHRYPIPLRLLFRRAGERRWRSGIVENISYSGVMFRANRLMRPNTPVEMTLLLPSGIPGELPARVECSGAIVRAVSPENSRGVHLAATIAGFDFVRVQKTSQT